MFQCLRLNPHHKFVSFMIAILMAPAVAQAFVLDEHILVTNRAYEEFTNCFPEYRDQILLEELIQANLDEDLNIFRKQLRYAHFFHPEKNLDLMWRGDSGERITDLTPELKQCRAPGRKISRRDLHNVGHVIHHLQDMAVPAHVVPVNHSFWDGFENLAMNDDVTSEWNCATIVENAVADRYSDLENILRLTSRQTLTNIRELTIEAVRPDQHRIEVFRGADFWAEASDNGFGDYGKIGNHFGINKFSISDGNVVISLDAYRIFKLQQMTLAVQATLRTMMWVFHKPAKQIALAP